MVASKALRWNEEEIVKSGVRSRRRRRKAAHTYAAVIVLLVLTLGALSCGDGLILGDGEPACERLRECLPGCYPDAGEYLDNEQCKDELETAIEECEQGGGDPNCEEECSECYLPDE